MLSMYEIIGEEGSKHERPTVLIRTESSDLGHRCTIIQAMNIQLMQSLSSFLLASVQTIFSCWYLRNLRGGSIGLRVRTGHVLLFRFQNNGGRIREKLMN